MSAASQLACATSDHTSARRALPVSREALDRASELFRAMGDTARLRLLALLSQGPACVSELAAIEGETISTISQRLRVLRSERLVTRRRDGKHINYALADQHVLDLVFSAMAHASESPAQTPGNEFEPEKEQS
jgi:ArsR family transcriptional regulator